jgi:hypothetical protein
MSLQVLEVRGLAGRIHDEIEERAEVGNHQVVANAARVRGEEAVSLSAYRQRYHIDGYQGFQRAGRIGVIARAGTQRHLAHVRDVEKSGSGARMMMFAQNP